MTRWTAIVPLNHGRPRKTRLASILSPDERNALALAMARHVVAILQAAPSVGAIRLLSPVDPALRGTYWVRDAGRGLNTELAMAREAEDGPVLLIHADLPLLTVPEIETLLEDGSAIAPDAAGIGTNALALAETGPFLPAFGPDSLALHRAALPGARLVTLSGLIHDIDDADSLHNAVALGFVPPLLSI